MTAQEHAPTSTERNEAIAAEVLQVAAELAPGALSLVNIARGACGAGPIAAFSGGTPWTRHPLLDALQPCGVVQVGDGLVDVLDAYVSRVVHAWYPMGFDVDECGRAFGGVELPLPDPLARWLAAFDASCVAARAAEADGGAA